MRGPWGKHVDVQPDRGGWDADRALTALYGEHYSALVRMAWLLTADVARAEQVVQDSFVSLHRCWRRPRDGELALAYLRRSVVSRSRSVRPRRFVPGQDAASAIMLALRVLPVQERETLVMRYYAGLTVTETAEILGIGERAVRQHAEQALGALRGVLAASNLTANDEAANPRAPRQGTSCPPARQDDGAFLGELAQR